MHSVSSSIAFRINVSENDFLKIRPVLNLGVKVVVAREVENGEIKKERYTRERNKDGPGGERCEHHHRKCGTDHGVCQNLILHLSLPYFLAVFVAAKTI